MFIVEGVGDNAMELWEKPLRGGEGGVGCRGVGGMGWGRRRVGDGGERERGVGWEGRRGREGRGGEAREGREGWGGEGDWGAMGIDCITAGAH